MESKPFVSEEWIARIGRVRTAQDRGREQGMTTAKGQVEKFRSQALLPDLRPEDVTFG